MKKKKTFARNKTCYLCLAVLTAFEKRRYIGNWGKKRFIFWKLVCPSKPPVLHHPFKLSRRQLNRLDNFMT